MINNRQYERQFDTWYKHAERNYTHFSTSQRTAFSSFQQLVIWPNLAIIAYCFKEVSPCLINCVLFGIVMLVISTPIIASGVGYYFLTRYYSGHVFVLDKIMQNPYDKETKNIFEKNYLKLNYKIPVVANWEIFTLGSIFISLIFAILIKYDYLYEIKIASITVFIFYLIALFIFLYQLNKNLVKQTV